jgi:hypothetical protein
MRSNAPERATQARCIDDFGDPLDEALARPRAQVLGSRADRHWILPYARSPVPERPNLAINLIGSLSRAE